MKAASLYFALVFAAGFVLGPVRVLLLEPRLGEAVATLIEAPLMLTAMILAAGWISYSGRAPATSAGFLVMGSTAALLVLVADLAVGTGLRGLSLANQVARFTTAPGQIYLALLAVFALVPWMLSSPWKRN